MSCEKFPYIPEFELIKMVERESYEEDWRKTLSHVLGPVTKEMFKKWGEEYTLRMVCQLCWKESRCV